MRPHRWQPIRLYLPFLGFSRQEHWSGLPFPFPMHENEKWKWSCSVVSDSTTPWRRQWQPTPVLLPGKSHGQRSLVGYNLWGREELDTSERLHFHFSLSCIGEGNGNPLQCSCLENPRDGGAWWAAICGVAQSRTWLMQLSSSSSSNPVDCSLPGSSVHGIFQARVLEYRLRLQ